MNGEERREEGAFSARDRGASRQGGAGLRTFLRPGWAARLLRILLFSMFMAGYAFCQPGPPADAPRGPERPEPDRSRVRMPAVAGSYYPGDPQKLKKLISECFERAVRVKVPGRLRALIMPHAGYAYSGPVAASACAALSEKYSKVVILAASHHARYYGVSISDREALRTPLGDVPVDPEARALLALPGFSTIPAAEKPEHSIEVELPFLQTALPDGFSVIPLLLGEVDPKVLAGVLLPYIDDGTLLVASTDLTHYLSYDEAKRLDSACTRSIVGLDPSGIGEYSACGRLAVFTLMEIARIKGWKGMLIDQRNSGDTTDMKDRVVGYAAIAFYSDGKEQGENMESQVSQEDRSALLTLARTAITAHLIKDGGVKRPEKPSAVLRQKRGCFVTLHKSGQLRGCIGTIEPVMPLEDCVEQNAINAAFRDPRFSQLTAAELSEIEIEVSVLSVPKPLDFSSPEDLVKKLKPNVHGVILTCGRRRATFLPQVWEQIPNAESFLIHLCVKAGCTPNCWKSPDVKIETYEAEYFSE